MQGILAIFLVFVGAPTAIADDAATNPIAKVIQMIDDLAAKVSADGEAADKAYGEYFEWCDDTTKGQGFDIKTAIAQKAKLEAKIEKLGDDIEAAGPKIEELAADISESEDKLGKATDIRKQEKGNFAKEETELVEGVDMLTRATSILEREMAKNPAALAQFQVNGDLTKTLESLSLVLDAASFSGNDRQKLVALVQANQADGSEDAEFGAPAAAAYKSKSGGIVEVLEDMKEKAEAELSELRSAETKSKQDFNMLRQSLEAQMVADKKNLAEEKAGKAENEEAKAAAEGDFEITVKSLSATQKALKDTQAQCIQVGADQQASIKSRAEELQVIAKAKKILVETTGGAVASTYSFAQVASNSASRATRDVVVVIKRLARQHKSSALAQLASRIASAARYSDDPFVKVRGLIEQMITKLQQEAKEDATEKAFCDEEMSKTEAKKSELDDDHAKLTAKIDQAVAKTADTKADIKRIEEELAKLVRTQAEMDKIRQEENADYKKLKADLELGLSGVQKALAVLRDYYEKKDGAALLQDGSEQPAPPEKHDPSSGGASGIIDILEVAESDISRNLADVETEEADQQSAYDKTTQENKVNKAEKEDRKSVV